MALLGIDCATTTGFALETKDRPIRAYSFRPRAKREVNFETGKIDFTHRGKAAMELLEHIQLLIADQMNLGDPITDVAIEMPLRSNITFTKTEVNPNAVFFGQAVTKHQKGGTTMAVMYSLYGLHTIACAAFADVNINIHVVDQNAWRSSFYRGERPPRGTSDQTKWWKNLAKTYCERLRIEVPNADAAEAVGILWWLKAQIEPKHRAAESLFGG